MNIENKNDNRFKNGVSVNNGITDPELAKIFGRTHVAEKSPEMRKTAVNENRESVKKVYATYNDTVIHSVSDVIPDMKICSEEAEARKLKGLKKIRLYMSFLSTKENLRKLTCLVISGFLILLLIINILIPSSKLSVKENRTLAQFPKFSISSLKSGKFMSDFEEYVSDQFVFRNHFVAAKRRYETMLGKKSNHGILICDDGYLIENTSELSFENLETNIEAIKAVASVGRYDVKVAVVPTAYEILKDKLPAFSYTDTYTDFLNKLTHTADEAVVIDTKPALEAYKDEYVYYRSDHHQTALGSYATYTAIAEASGLQPFAEEKFMVETMSEDFCGTAWSNSGFAETENDIIYKYTLRKGQKCTVDFPMDKKTMDSLYSDEMLSGKDKYAYYLDGNHAIAEIKTNSKGGRLAIIKDSYAHSIVPFLANHYSEIYMIDPRYYNGDIFEYLYEHNIKDVLFLYNQNTFMTDGNLSKITEFAKTSKYTRVPDVSYGIVPELEAVDASYFDNAVFVGDSLTIGIQNFSGFNSTFLCAGGLNTETLESPILDNGSSVIETIEGMDNIGKLYIMLGTNEVAFDDLDLFLTRYSAFIDRVRDKFPNVIVYIESIMPVTNLTSQTTGITNEAITLYNEKLLQMAKEKECYYVDCHSYFEGEDGALPDNIGSDGIHLGPEKYREFADYLASHAVPEFGVSKIGEETKQTFAEGGKYDTAKIAGDVYEKIEFKDELAKVADSILISTYKLNAEDICSGAMYLGGGATAEEIAVIEAKNKTVAKELEDLAKERIERKKDDFRNYIPAEMTKLNNPVIVRNGNMIAVCIADDVSKLEIAELIE